MAATNTSPILWHSKTFAELTNTELYGILVLRSEVFVVEQNCVFLDIDGLDVSNCTHVFASQEHRIIAYARIFPPNTIYPETCLSRVCTSLQHRGKGLGKELIQRSLQELTKQFPNHPVKIGAQVYLIALYESFGFRSIGQSYMEDGIAHIHMVKQRN